MMFHCIDLFNVISKLSLRKTQEVFSGYGLVFEQEEG